MTFIQRTVQALIEEQEQMSGVSVWEEARMIPGLFVDGKKRSIVSCENEPRIVRELIERYKNRYEGGEGEMASRAQRRLSMTVAVLGERTEHKRIMEEVHRTHVRVLEEVEADTADAVIMETTQLTPDLRRQLTEAMLKRTPTLCLYERNHEPRELLAILKHATAPRWVRVHGYTASSLKQMITRFIDDIAAMPKELGEAPSIKFTLRLTPSVDRFLRQQAKEGKCSKAELVRQWIEEQKRKG